MKCIGCGEVDGATSVQFTVFKKVVAERLNQLKFKKVNEKMTDAEMLAVVSEEHGEVAREINDCHINLFKNNEADQPELNKATHAEVIEKHHKNKMKEELYQLAATCFQWLERIELHEEEMKALAEF